MHDSPPTVVLGCYRSGSSLLAGILDTLGVNMGPPFWGNHFESADLSEQLRRWWREPDLVESASVAERIAFLKGWRCRREAGASGPIGAKHPLLSLSMHDVEQAWGRNIKWIWSRRDLVASILSLQQVNWWPNPERVQRKLWKAVETFLRDRGHLALDYTAVLREPSQHVERLIEFLELAPTPAQVQGAIALVDPGKQSISRGSHLRTKRTTLSGARNSATALSKIVATVITGNSEELVEAAVISVRDFVDEFIIIDTGVTDATRERIVASTNREVRSVKFDWCDDFAKARNYALDAARDFGATWALTLDTDERLDFSRYASRESLRQQLDSGGDVEAWLVMAKDHSYAKERVIRVPSRLYWSGRTHEALVAPPDAARRVLRHARFWEKPKSVEAFQRKCQRDLEIIGEELKVDRKRPRLWFYLGQTHEGLGDKEQAFKSYYMCASTSQWSEEAAWSAFKAASCLADLGRYHEAETICVFGLTRDASFPELPWLTGWCCFRRGAFRQAVNWSQMAISLGCYMGNHAATSRLGFRYLPAWYEGPFDVQRFALADLNDSAGAEQAKLRCEEAKQMRIVQLP